MINIFLSARIHEYHYFMENFEECEKRSPILAEDVEEFERGVQLIEDPDKGDCYGDARYVFTDKFVFVEGLRGRHLTYISFGFIKKDKIIKTEFVEADDFLELHLLDEDIDINDDSQWYGAMFSVVTNEQYVGRSEEFLSIMREKLGMDL